MPKATICSTRVGLFPNRPAAELAVADLKKAGYQDDQIGMLAKDPEVRAMLAGGTGETNACEGATVGAVTGGVVGAGVGAAVLTGAIPVIGPVLALGTLGTILLNAAGGAAVAGTAGALIGWGIPEDDARYYEEQVRGGMYLVTVDAEDRPEDAYRHITRHGGYERATAPMV